MKTKSSVAVFHVKDLSASVTHYKEVLGFTDDFKHEHYVGLKIGDAGLHLASGGNRPVGASTAYFFCDEVDSYFAAIKAKGARIQAEPQDYFYGMRDFTVADPDGNHLSFGCPVLAK